MINKDLRDSKFKEISKKLGNDVAEIIEKSIFDFSDQYAESNGTPFLLQQIYESKAEEIICILNGKNLEYIISSIKNNKLDPSKIGFMSINELNKDQYDAIMKKKEKSNIKNQSSSFECKKCKKKNCSITERQVRSGDEPATLFINCQECGHVFTL